MFKIKDWERFESGSKARRPTGPMQWVSLPADTDSRGSQTLVSMGVDGVTALGFMFIFILLVQNQAQRPEAKRDGAFIHTDKTPKTLREIEFSIRFKNLGKYVDILMNIGWLVPIDQTLIKHCTTMIKHRSNLDHGSANIDHYNTRQVQVQDKNIKAPQAARVGDKFEEFWEAFPSQRKTKKKESMAAFLKAIKKGVDPDLIIRKAKAFATSEDGRGEFCPGPAPWLNQERWNDDESAWTRKPAAPTRPPEYIIPLEKYVFSLDRNGVESFMHPKTSLRRYFEGNDIHGKEFFVDKHGKRKAIR